jgi:hypothetical protein
MMLDGLRKNVQLVKVTKELRIRTHSSSGKALTYQDQDFMFNPRITKKKNPKPSLVVQACDTSYSEG